ncbi:MAG: DEAD/DEAH box helicase, partial [Pseudomonadota bacterium]
AFVLPLLSRLAGTKDRAGPKHCRALILVPTRELAAQITDAIASYGRNLRLHTALIVGGVKYGGQIKALARGVDIVIATPGRLEDHMGTGALHLDRATTVVLDEADQMFDLGFFPAIRRIMTALPAERQTAMFSATMPKEIQALAADFQDNPAHIEVAPQARPIEAIDQQIIPVEPGEKPAILLKTLTDQPVTRAVIFTRTKRGADRVAKHLAANGIKSAAIHGNKTQSQRTRALDGFRDGKTPILVATDIAARGIDIDDVSHVFNYELPNMPEAYVHRIGRTARAGKTGTAISLCAPDERAYLADIEKLIGRTLLDDGYQPQKSAPARRRRNGKPRNRKPGGGNAGQRPARSGDQSQRRTPNRHRGKQGNPHQGKPSQKPAKTA